MKLTELIIKGVPAHLRHPVLGEVLWAEVWPAQGYALYWAKGREKHEPLVVDSTVLFCDKWELLDENGESYVPNRFELLIEAVKRKTPEQTRADLIRIGVINEDGTLTEHYGGRKKKKKK